MHLPRRTLFKLFKVCIQRRREQQTTPAFRKPNTGSNNLAYFQRGVLSAAIPPPPFLMLPIVLKSDFLPSSSCPLVISQPETNPMRREETN